MSRENFRTIVSRGRKSIFLALYDVLFCLLVDLLLLIGYKGSWNPTPDMLLIHILILIVLTVSCRSLCKVYHQIWRYGDVSCYMRLLFADAVGGVLYLAVNYLLPVPQIAFSRLVAICCLNDLLAMTVRMVYRYAYKYGGRDGWIGKMLRLALRIFAGRDVQPNVVEPKNATAVAIVGAGVTGTTLADELLNTPGMEYVPRCFIEVSNDKIGRSIQNIPVFAFDDELPGKLEKCRVQEIILAVPQLSTEEKKELFDYYSGLGYRVKIYDYPIMERADGKRRLREFDVEDLLFRQPINVAEDSLREYYSGKVVMVTGGGGSIGSELCRQLAKMQPKEIVILDVAENGAYELQQELKMLYGDSLNVHIAIVSVCNRAGLNRVFAFYRPQIVLHAAAHKHVPLMERDCVEAVENNVFGTLNTVEACEKWGVERFILISTDKAVNPTNVMGATKRMCEMIVQSRAAAGSPVKYSMTRFGNVLGSAGSVIPLFRRQIAAGGPVTVTDRRIIRYFMTISEATQLVLQSGAMAKNGDLFVLDMGRPVKILELAENMIRLAGYEPYVDMEIIETGLRPGEKLYEELLVKGENTEKTENDLIFIEHDEPLPPEEIDRRLELLREAVSVNNDDNIREILRACVPTFHTPESVNAGIGEEDSLTGQ